VATRVLLIDDSRLIRKATERVLTRAGYAVLSAGDGEEALSMARQELPDLILLDMLLPRLGGEKVLQHLKQRADTASIPVIVLSSLAEQNAAKLREEGAAAFFPKSRLLLDEQLSGLLQVVREVLRSEPKKCQESAVV
jgi:CheY-like chemotaxis protein